MRSSRTLNLWLIVLTALLVAGLILGAIGRLGPVQGAFARVVTPALDGFHRLGAGLAGIFETLRGLSDLHERNQQLTELVTQLAAENVQLKEMEAENEILRRLLDFAQSSPGRQFKAAEVRVRVVGRDPSNLRQYIFIAAGSEDGMAAGMPVVTERGLVGRIEEVYPTVSRVRLIIDADSSVNALIQRTRATGIVRGRPGGILLMDYLPQEPEALAVGDFVLTSGVGGRFPRQLVIGQIIEIYQRDYEMFQQALVRPSVDFDRLEFVLVITNFIPLRVPTPPAGSELPLDN